MRVFFTDGTHDDYPTVTHWDCDGSDWVELLNDQEEIIVVLNWTHVQKLEIVPWLH